MTDDPAKRIIVCGGRNFADTELAYTVLDKLRRTRGVEVVVEGDQRGAHRIAGYWARKNRLRNEKFHPNWDKYGAAATAMRNQEMLESGADLVVAFPGGTATADMIKRARKAGIEILRIEAKTGPK